MAYCIYLRKSRADLEAEIRGEGETLARHKKLLLETAKRLNLVITEIYPEVVSGDTLAARPVMQQVLSEVEQGMWEGVLVTEVERLARGDTIDQGIVAQAFKVSRTKIITPAKIYDPDNEFDEEYFEFGLFMSRREYKTINRRLQGGRTASAKEGKFVGSIAPFGYKRYKLTNDKGFSLEIVPGDAEIVREIFRFYTTGELCEDGSYKRLGIQSIARKLNILGVPPIKHEYWQKETIVTILTNPAYAGKIRWGYRKGIKKVSGGTKTVSRPISEEYILVNGLHQAIIDEETFNLAQYYMSQMPPAPVGYKSEIKNPLAGLIICGKCGRKMVFRRGTGKKPSYIVCHMRACSNVSSPFHLVENKVINALRIWLQDHTLTLDVQNNKAIENVKAIENTIKKMETEIQKLSAQLSRAHDAFEQGVYTIDVFLKRSSNINERAGQVKEELEKLRVIYDKEKARTLGLKRIIPQVIKLIDVYDKLSTPKEKNDMLKQVLEKAVYTKEKSGMYRGVSTDDFELVLFPRIPKG